MSKDINLDTHITDIVNVFKWEDLKDVCLVVHSYGGYPGSGALEQIGDRVSSIVWLDAFKPENGERLFDVTSEFSRKGLLAAMEKGEPGRPSKAEAFAVNEKDRAWVDSKTTPQPNGVALQPIKLTGAREKVAKKTYIRAAAYPQPTFDKALAECKADKSWRTFEPTNCGHDVMVDAPQWLAMSCCRSRKKETIAKRGAGATVRGPDWVIERLASAQPTRRKAASPSCRTVSSNRPFTRIFRPSISISIPDASPDTGFFSGFSDSTGVSTRTIPRDHPYVSHAANESSHLLP